MAEIHIEDRKEACCLEALELLKGGRSNPKHRSKSVWGVSEPGDKK